MNRAYFNALKVVAKQIPPTDLFLLDLFPDAAAAFSFRKLRAAYSGAAIRVRRSSDNAEQDIGFDANNDLDTAALLDFVGSGNGFVTKYYDQGLLGADSQNTDFVRQQRIVNAGVLQTRNGKPCAVSPESANAANAYTLNTSSILTTSFVYARNNSNTVEYIAGINGGGLFVGGTLSEFNGVGFFVAPTARSSNLGEDLNQHISLFYTKNTNDGFVRVDNSGEVNIGDLGNTSYNFNTLFGRSDISNNAVMFRGIFQEAIFWPVDYSGQAIAIRDNQNSYYNVY